MAGVREDTGERVVALIGSGGYAEYAVAPRGAHVRDARRRSTTAAALAMIIQGTTAWHLYRTAARVAAGESVVVHCAAGGVGSLAVQLGRAFGAGRVIATASSEQRRALTLELGADVAIDPAPEGLTERLLEANGGSPVDVVFEMSGGEVFDASYRGARPVRADRRLRDLDAGPQRGLARARCCATRGRWCGFYLFHCLRAPADVRASARRPVRARRARAS